MSREYKSLQNKIRDFARFFYYFMSRRAPKSRGVLSDSAEGATEVNHSHAQVGNVNASQSGPMKVVYT